MLAMQYSIRLPEGFDASVIRKRVEDRAKLFDHLPGLAHKSFLFNDYDQLYAPFYLWETQHAARSFLLDDLFRGVIDTFSRPRVRTWSVLETAYADTRVLPACAIIESDSISPDEKLDALLAREQKARQVLLKQPGLYFCALALDADRWEIVRYSLWQDAELAIRPGADVTQTFQVLHISEPEGHMAETDDTGGSRHTA